MWLCYDKLYRFTVMLTHLPVFFHLWSLVEIFLACVKPAWMDADIGSLILEWMHMDDLAGRLCIGWTDCRILVRRPDTLPLPVDAVTLSLFPKFMFHSTVRLPRRGNTRKDPSTPTSPPQTTSLVSDFLWVVFFLYSYTMCSYGLSEIMYYWPNIAFRV